MKFNILTLFPEMFTGFLTESMIKRALDEKKFKIDLINIRDYTDDKHNTVDDSPFGGGPGMVLKPEPLFKSLSYIKEKKKNSKKSKVIYVSPQGEKFNQEMAKDFSKLDEITILAGRYEGVDERVIDEFVDMEVSIGDFVLTGGELPAMVMIDAITRLLPGVLGNSDSYKEDSFYNGLLDHPHYTRPSEYKGKKVPDILLSGHHANIKRWRMKKSLKRTLERRPDLIDEKDLNKEQKNILKEIKDER
ncbi:MAG: tRNA (guanosine(37)-N1)-methyltransferase TrmD [Fusobacteriota bacterium]